MPLEDLLELVGTLRDRIDEHGNELRQSEALTRYALIDPLLRGLGWDTDDPTLVIPEYRSGNGRADYALLSDGKPSMMVEAKSLGTSLRDTVLSQGIQYCLMEGTSHFTVTDGQRWEIYETHRAVPINEKRVADFDLKGQSPAGECLKALALWRPSVQARYVGAGSALAISEDESNPIESRDHAHSSSNIQPTTDGSKTTTPRKGDQDWQLVSLVFPESGTKPAELMFPDGTHIFINSWKAMLVEIARWLIKTNHLTAGRCPIPYSDRSKRYVVALNPFHQDGTQFVESAREEVGPFHIDTNHSARQIVQSTRALIEHVGQDPAEFKVRHR